MEEPVCCTAAPCEAAARHTALFGTEHVLAPCTEMTPCSSRREAAPYSICGRHGTLRLALWGEAVPCVRLSEAPDQRDVLAAYCRLREYTVLPSAAELHTSPPFPPPNARSRYPRHTALQQYSGCGQKNSGKDICTREHHMCTEHHMAPPNVRTRHWGLNCSSRV